MNTQHPIVNEVVALGASPRGVQALILAGKVRALLEGTLCRGNRGFEGGRS